jgi:hypothetical protein
MMGAKARVIGAAAVAAAALAAAGCTGSTGGTVAAGATATGQSGAVTGANAAAMSLVSDVMNKAQAAGTVRMQGTVTTATTGTMDVSGEEQYSPSVEMSMSTQIQGQSLSEVLIGTTFYMDYPALAAEMGGKPWGEIDLAKAGGALGSLSSLANTARNYNPTTQLQALIASGRVADVGTQTVDGQQTTHYQGKLTVSQMAAQISGLTSAQLSTLKETLQASGITYELVDLFVPSSGLPVEVKYVSQSPGGQVSTDLHLSDWGAPVQIGAPPASQVFDLTSRLASSQASTGASGT